MEMSLWGFVGVIIVYLICHSASECFDHQQVVTVAECDEVWLTSNEQGMAKMHSYSAERKPIENSITTEIELRERIRRDTTEILSSNTEPSHSEDDYGYFRSSPRVCVFFDQLLSSMDALLSLVPSDPWQRRIHLMTAMDNAWARRNRRLKYIVKRLMIDPTEDEFAEYFWQPFNDLDVDVEPQLATNPLKRILAQLGKVDTLEYATPQWMEDLEFWQNASRQVYSVGVNNFELSPLDEKAIRELTMPSARQKESWREMQSYQFFTPDRRRVSGANQRQQVETARYHSCMWVMRCELHDLRVYRLMGYLRARWRGARRLLTEDTKMSQVIDIFCTAASKMYWLGLDKCPRRSAVGAAGGEVLTRDEYATFLKLVEVEYYPSTVHRDTVRILLKFFYPYGGRRPIPL